MNQNVTNKTKSKSANSSFTIRTMSFTIGEGGNTNKCGIVWPLVPPSFCGLPIYTISETSLETRLRVAVDKV